MNWVVKILLSNNTMWSEKPPRSSFPKEESGRKICMSKRAEMKLMVRLVDNRGKEKGRRCRF
jgi:hypothetical protein